MTVRTFLLFLLFLPIFSHRVYAWGESWISAPWDAAGAHVQFRTMVVQRSSDRPVRARAVVSTTGFARFFINGCQVGQSIFFPYRTAADEGVALRSEMDITPFLRADTNVVSVLCASTSFFSEPVLLSVKIEGETVSGAPWTVVSDSTWLCAPAPSRLLPSGGEETDGRRVSPMWNSTTPKLMRWMPVAYISSENAPKVRSEQQGLRLRWVYGKQYSDVVPSGVDYEMETAFWGQVRLTLRGAKRGGVVCYDRHRYICSGELDEQAFPWFASQSYRRLVVSSSEMEVNVVVERVEGLDLRQWTQPFGLYWALPSWSYEEK